MISNDGSPIARAGELASFAAGIDRDIHAIKTAITQPWSTSSGHQLSQDDQAPNVRTLRTPC
ncbi:hypothetical protein [Bradyrhizobium icense]|uniref:hypothetical protein n=1 Tax=Bradyrhizobium icense TaxID=1274631 RepID=UPI0012E9A0AE|nr:hypothetical protein [Bradyrhizobium icense]